MTTLPLLVLVPVPGCLPGSEPTTYLRTPPADRKFTPASTSETRRKSSVETGTLYPNRVRPRIVQAVTGGPAQARGHQCHLNHENTKN